MTTITWSIERLITETIGTETNYVVHADYKCEIVDGEYIGYYCGTANFSTDNVGNFIPYNQLTEEDVVAWVQAFLTPVGVAQTEECCLQQIAVQKQPSTPSETPPLPW